MRYAFAVKVEPSTAFQQMVNLAPITAVVTTGDFDALVPYETLDSACPWILVGQTRRSVIDHVILV